MAGLTTRYYNLTGGLNTTQDIGTINQSSNKTDTPSSFNVELHGLGGIRTMRGNKPIGQRLSTIVTLGHEYRQGSDKRLVVTTADGKVWLYNRISNTFEEIYQFKTPTRRHSIVDFNQGIVITNGVDDLVYYQYGRNELQDGSVTLTNGSKSITGIDTKFTRLGVGDYITFKDINGSYRIDEIESDTSLTLDKDIDVTVATKKFFAWTYSSNTYYTEVEADENDVNVYKYNGNSMEVQPFKGTITSGKLKVSSIENKTVVTVDVDLQEYNYSLNNSTYANNLKAKGMLASGICYDGRLNTSYKLDMLANSTFTSTTKYNTLKEIHYKDVFTVGGMSITQDAPIQLNGGKLYYGIGFYDTNPVVGTYTKTTNTIKDYVEEVQTVSVTTTYTRNSSEDKETTINMSGVQFYLSELSELNAVYVNSDDESVREVIRGLALQTWQGRLFVGGNDGVLYYSEIGLIHGWDLKYGAGAIPMFYNDNSDFTGLGLYSEYLVIHRKDYTYYLMDQGGGGPDFWQLVPFSDVSCESQQSWISTSNSYFVYSRINQGIFPLLKRTIFSNNYLGEPISQKIRNDFEYINDSYYDRIFPVFEPHKRFIMWYMPMIQGSGSNYCYCYDTLTKSWWLRIVPQNVTIAFRFDDRVYIGTQDGLVLQEFKGLDFNGEGIEFSYRTPWFSFGDGTNYLSTREFRCKLDGEYTNNFYVRNRRDGEESFTERFVTDSKGGIDSLIWDAGYTSQEEGVSDDTTLTDTVWDEFDWVDSSHIVKRFPLANQFFQSQQLEFYGKGENEGIALYGFELDRVEQEEVPW